MDSWETKTTGKYKNRAEIRNGKKMGKGMKTNGQAKIKQESEVKKKKWMRLSKRNIVKMKEPKWK